MARIKPGVFSWEDVLAQRYQNNKPTALPRPRKHPLNRSQPQKQQQQQQDTRLVWSAQPNCPLLSSLSAELRLMIWELVLGGMRIHIVQRPNRRMGHVVCPRTKACEICRGGLPSREGDRKLLGLVMACKQIYSESLHLLYTHNTFEFSNTWSLTYLCPTIPLDLWNCIRAVELRWAFPGHWLPSKDPVKTVYFSAGRQQWVETCRALTRMAGLQRFTLQLSGSWFCEPVEKIPVFLEPLRELRVKGCWRLQLPRQVYYGEEIRRVSGVLRERGIECLVC
ncbi:hypothetical protein P170DRAFT_439281 [Aspergillus steynii IBT 23096]|uniref:DUF7730 domain-containing protein n=1 Tax=Aspergillus steynii IBT 23096 TaxID=1392250 RepID=A0A2I2FY27_9EURO|nr:uncharacterized protein P170DRAFT_439281 [Aspergillus steynii IBT 23096]PLB45532.1 hypothetical protein P170DRAFT_439281 [Aspergillus steynii IBT 23096]